METKETKQFEVGQRVSTQHGVGTVVDIEEHLDLVFPLYRYGIKHDTYPKCFESVRDLYPTETFYYGAKEISKIS